MIQFQAYASIAVAAVQQSMSTANAQDKKAAAVRKLSDLTKNTLKPTDIDHLSEDAVFTFEPANRSFPYKKFKLLLKSNQSGLPRNLLLLLKLLQLYLLKNRLLLSNQQNSPNKKNALLR